MIAPDDEGFTTGSFGVEAGVGTAMVPDDVGLAARSFRIDGGFGFFADRGGAGFAASTLAPDTVVVARAEAGAGDSEVEAAASNSAGGIELGKASARSSMPSGTCMPLSGGSSRGAFGEERFTALMNRSENFGEAQFCDFARIIIHVTGDVGCRRWPGVRPVDRRRVVRDTDRARSQASFAFHQ